MEEVQTVVLEENDFKYRESESPYAFYAWFDFKKFTTYIATFCWKNIIKFLL